MAIGPMAALGSTGSDNIAVGDKALANSDRGDENVAIGESALSYCTGSNNVALGTVPE